MLDHHVSWIALIDGYCRAIAVRRMIEDLAGAVLVGPVILRSGEGVSGLAGVLVQEFELRDVEASVDPVGPTGTSIRGFVDASISASENNKVNSRVESESAIIGVNVLAYVACGPSVRHCVAREFMQTRTAEVDDVRS